jgi:site-specific DNA-methyltransferase (adenine-specific)
MTKVAREIKRVLCPGRIACIVCDDILIEGKKFPIVADLTKIFIKEGFDYRDKIIWIKPEGYIRISRRSGVVLQNHTLCTFILTTSKRQFLFFRKGNLITKVFLMR